MRHDMDKILQDTYSNGKGYDLGKNSREANFNLEDLPKNESISKKWKKNFGGKSKEVRLAPFERWLETQIGKKWDNIYSEVSNLYDKRSYSQLELFKWLKRLIIFDVEYIDGIPYETTKKRYWVSDKITKDDLYVCPDTGTLKRGTVARKKELRDITLEQIAGVYFKDSRSIEKTNGIWYQIKYKRNENYIDAYPFLQNDGGFWRRSSYSECSCYIIDKKQLNKKQIKKVENYITDCLVQLNKLKKDRWKHIDRFNDKGFFILFYQIPPPLRCGLD